MSKAAGLRLEPLASPHEREAFACGVESLDRYLKQQAAQDVRRMANAVFVLTDPIAPREVIGYFSLCATAVVLGDVPEALRRRLPRYPLVSATLIGRLAVARNRHGEGVGAALLSRALTMAWQSAATIGSCMVVVDAIDEQAARFYAAHGFTRLADSMRLLLPMESVGKAVDGASWKGREADV